MASFAAGNAMPMLSGILSLLKVLVWPIFLWLFTKRPDVRKHIGSLTEIFSRILSLKLGPVRLKMDKKVHPLPDPDQEVENDITVQVKEKTKKVK